MGKEIPGKLQIYSSIGCIKKEFLWIVFKTIFLKSFRKHCSFNHIENVNGTIFRRWLSKKQHLFNIV